MAERLGVGLLGCGTVGTAVARRLIADWELLGERAGAQPVLRHVAMRDLQRGRDVTFPDGVRRTDDARAVVGDADVAVVIEVMGGLEPATACIEAALTAGKHVVTANKAVIASHGPRLAALAARHDAGLWFEASVGAGLPILTLLRDSLRGDRITSIEGIVNGTTNVILTRMRAGTTFADALAEARLRGFAEADPSSDVEGWDAAYKLVIMVWLGMGVRVRPEAVDRHGIASLDVDDVGYAAQLGHDVKLVARAEARPGHISARVRPALVPRGHALHGVDDADNAVVVRSDLAGTVQLRGLGAGADSTASAVLSDVVQAVLHRDAPPRVPVGAELPATGDEDVDVAGYVRLRLGDVQDAESLVVQALEDRGVPVSSVVPVAPRGSQHQQLLVLTGTAPRAVHERALETLDTLQAVAGIACTLDRIEL